MTTSDAVDAAVRGPMAFDVAGRALSQMQALGVAPTPLNYELWLYALASPQSPIGFEINRLISIGRAISDVEAEALALQHLPRLRLPEELREAGDALTQQLDTIGKVISSAQKNAREYGQTLEGATRELSSPSDLAHVRRVLETVAHSTRRVQVENATLETQLMQSTDEVRRLRENLEQVRRDALTDALTNLANRKAFDEALARCHAEAAASGRPLTVAVLDIDHFKRFNDTWGHQAGDQVIRYVASMIGASSPHPRFAARYGGEEFAILFPGENAALVQGVLDELREEIGSRALKRRSTAEELGVVTVSAGLATLRPDESAHSLVERADAALYMSKRGGRNKTTNGESLAA